MSLSPSSPPPSSSLRFTPLSVIPVQWRVSLAGISALILTVGLARFAYTPMLPLMRAQTWLGDSAAGWLATFNYSGYMAGALLAASISSLSLKFRLYRVGLVVALLGTAGMGMTQDMVVWSLLRFFAGMSSCAGLLIGSGLVLNWLMRHQYRAELGVHFSGIGLGIAISGLAVSLFSAGESLWGVALDWAGHWYALAALGGVFFLPAWAWMPAPAPANSAAAQSLSAGEAPSRRWAWLFTMAYFCTAFGFVISATFLVAIVVRQPGMEKSGALVWIVVGAAAAPACLIWDRVARRVGDIPALMIAAGLQIVSFLLPAFSPTLGEALLSAFLFGGTFIGLVSLTLSIIGRLYPANPAKAMARMTLAYGVGQIVGPALAGSIAEQTGSFQGALLFAAVTMLMSIGLLSILLKTPLRSFREEVGEASS